MSLRSRRQHKAWGASPRNTFARIGQIRGADDSARVKQTFRSNLSPASRALILHFVRSPGVSLRSTPGFMLSPASQAVSLVDTRSLEYVLLTLWQIRICQPAHDSLTARTIILQSFAVAHRIIKPEFLDYGL